MRFTRWRGRSCGRMHPGERCSLREGREMFSAINDRRSVWYRARKARWKRGVLISLNCHRRQLLLYRTHTKTAQSFEQLCDNEHRRTQLHKGWKSWKAPELFLKRFLEATCWITRSIATFFTFAFTFLTCNAYSAIEHENAKRSTGSISGKR